VADTKPISGLDRVPLWLAIAGNCALFATIACRAAWAEENSTRSILYLEKSMDRDGFSR
jgi:hypothetical protein